MSAATGVTLAVISVIIVVPVVVTAPWEDDNTTVAPFTVPTGPPESNAPTQQPSSLPSDSPSNPVIIDERCQFQVLNATEIPGPALTRIPLSDLGNVSPLEDIALCQSMCSAIPYCAGFSVYFDFLQVEPSCQLKYGPIKIADTVPVSGESVVSGIRQEDGYSESVVASCIGTTGNPNRNFDVFENSDLFGSDWFLPCVGLRKVTSLAETTPICIQLCRTSEKCLGFTAVDPEIGDNFGVFACCLKVAPLPQLSANASTTSGFEVFRDS